jgi:excisionase family DNA binding protein
MTATAAEATVIGAGAAARRLGISTQYLSQLATSGKLPFVPTPYGRAYRIDVVERFRESRDERSNSEAESPSRR